MARTRAQERMAAARAASGETRQAAHKAARLSARNNVCPLPVVANAERRRRCAASLLEFARECCSGILEREPSARLCEYARTIQAAIEGAGQVHVRMARGAGKTTWVKAALAWGLATGRIRYGVIFAASSELAAAIIADVWAIFENDETFAADWPEVAYPIRRAGGLSQRYASQHFGGVKTRIRKSAREIQLPSIPGMASSGGILMARGAMCSTRGLVRGKLRPDFILLDDIQTRADAANADRIRWLSDWVDGDVQGLVGARMLNAVMTSTPIFADDLSERYADTTLHPGWNIVSYRMLDGEAGHPEMWEEYAARWRAARRDGDMTFADATEFYRAHRADMDAGLDVLDPGNFDKRIELSGIQHAQNLRLIMGEESFRAEYQLEVRAAVDALAIAPTLVASRLNGSARGTLPPGTFQAVAFCDINAVAGISWVCVAYGPHGRAAVVDYGRYTGAGKRRLVPEGVTEAESQRIIAAGLSDVLRGLLDASLPTSTGKAERIAAVWVDAGFERKVVQSVCSVFRARTGRIVQASAGVAHDRYNPRGRHVIQRGDGVDFRQLDGDRWFAHDADRWRERAQRAWLGEPMQSGSLSLPGDSRRAHEAFADEVCAETLSEKITDSRGVTHYFWNNRPGASNHWLDALTGCMAMGAWYRLLDDTAEAIVDAGVHPATVAGTPPLRRPGIARRTRTFSPPMQ